MELNFVCFICFMCLICLQAGYGVTPCGGCAPLGVDFLFVAVKRFLFG